MHLRCPPIPIEELYFELMSTHMGAMSATSLPAAMLAGGAEAGAAIPISHCCC